MTDDSADSLPVFSAEGCCAQFWHRQECLLFDVVHPAFPLPTTASPTLKGALGDGLGRPVVALDMPKPCKSLSLDSCRKRSLWTHKEVDLVLQVGDAEKFPQAPGFKGLDSNCLGTCHVHIQKRKGPTCFSSHSKDQTLSLAFPPDKTALSPSQALTEPQTLAA